jgi:NtrC-family two-component system sensor histidine kinase KinB
MKLKSKISLALAFLFAAIVGIVVLGMYYLRDLSVDAENILKDNYESLTYTKKILEACDSQDFAAIEANLQLQEQNVTEPGEREFTLLLRKAFLNKNIEEIRRYCFVLQELNMKAIVAKSETTSETADRASNYLLIVATILCIVTFTFIVNFPGYIANPITALTNSIKSIANKQYEERLNFDRNDEFGELAEAFNQMAEKMDEYEHSNLAKILFEKKRIETIINRISDPVIGLDERKKVVFVNDKALSLLNLTREQMIDRYAPDVAVDNDLFRNIIRFDASSLIKIVVDGKENYFSRDITSGEVIFLKNITPFKELDLAKTNFIATISHELKTPIASLQMGIKLLHDDRVGKMNEEQKGIIATLSDETSRLSKLTHELLDLAQVETGNIKLDLQKIAPHDVILYAFESVKFHAERKKVKIEIQEDDHLPFIRADRDKTTWVLVNLLTNAIRYSPENERVILSCTADDVDVKFSVRDFGPGIDEKYVPRLFEKFFQVPGTPSGTGLGLTISKEFIEAQGGSINVESKPGFGSTFSFKISLIGA